ncbi:MAG: dephospho-CoA kinase [Saccharofermentanaceae bacterium]|jgi:dephospho-CoA kinase|nr:dephospho-CoA kinase [Clostridia bacterium]NLX67905.1 dephospho-CoA kinase [Clostridiaceae bacterium]HPG64318.1 dephospho-CoA kinase [Saccharofermentans sp.]HUM23635.1 dephospho-CoA kinase [Saccharofermentans sp.]
MFVLGVTGGIGCGKSSVCSILRDRGIRVLDADEISKDVTLTDGIAVPAIAEAFGTKAIDKNGAMNRKYISSIVFNDNSKLDLLSSIIHKYVFEYIESELLKEREKGTKCVVLDVPIPVKNGFVSNCNQIWVVTCDDNVRLERLIARNMTREEATRRMAVQMSNDEYISIGDYVIDNSSDLNHLYEQVNKLITEQLWERGIKI